MTPLSTPRHSTQTPSPKGRCRRAAERWVQTMLERDLVELRSTERGPRAFFTEAGLAALRQLVLDRRTMDPERFAHLRIELGLDP